MKKATFVMRWSLILLFCLGTFAALSPRSEAGNHCTDHCADVYHLKKDACKAIPYKHERHRCEDAAKHAKDQCKHRCR